MVDYKLATLFTARKLILSYPVVSYSQLW